MQLSKNTNGKSTGSRKSSQSLEMRLIATFFTLIITLILAMSIVLAATGVFDLNSSKTLALIEHELGRLYEQIKKDYAFISSCTVKLSESLTRELDLRLDEKNIKAGELAKYPEILTDLLDSIFPIVAAEIQLTRSSGIFLILDATVNPSLENAETSRAGIYIRNIAAQNNLSVSYNDLRYMYGPMSIAQSRKMQILPQWQMEYDVTAIEAYSIVMQSAKENIDRPLSQLYYWTSKESDGGFDYAMYCCVPILVDGEAIGICGYEINAMQFKGTYAPNINGQNYSFCMLAPSDTESIYFEKSMFAGNYAVTAEQPSGTVKKPSGEGLFTYHCGEAGDFIGRHTDISLYSVSSVHANNGFSVVLLTPKEHITAINVEANMKYIVVLILLLLISTTASVVLIRRNIKPVKHAIEHIRQSKTIQVEKTGMREIDDLFEYLSERDRENEDKLNRAERERQAALEKQKKAAAEIEIIQNIYVNDITQEQYDAFNMRLRTLTPKEREVYELYLQGKKAPEIASLLAITLNTVKFHNKNIYDKLGINSRKELLRYAKYKSVVNGK